jgi:hypothetical protein
MKATMILIATTSFVAAGAAYADAAETGPFNDFGGGFSQPEATPVVTRYGDHFYVPEWFYVNHYRNLRRYRGYFEPFQFYGSTTSYRRVMRVGSPQTIGLYPSPIKFGASEVDAFLRGETNTLNGYDALPFPGTNEFVGGIDGWCPISGPETNDYRYRALPFFPGINKLIRPTRPLKDICDPETNY